MDRDEALKLLEGGSDGIAEWNRRREAREEIPDLSGTDLRSANLDGAFLVVAHLGGAILSGASLIGANLSSANLKKADFTVAIFDRTAIADVDLSVVQGLDFIDHGVRARSG